MKVEIEVKQDCVQAHAEYPNQLQYTVERERSLAPEYSACGRHCGEAPCVCR